MTSHTSTTRRTRQEPARTAKACAVCGSRLSTYNANTTCWAHTVEVPWKGPNTRPR